jgi:hypothetical protein
MGSYSEKYVVNTTNHDGKHFLCSNSCPNGVRKDHSRMSPDSPESPPPAHVSEKTMLCLGLAADFGFRRGAVATPELADWRPLFFLSGEPTSAPPLFHGPRTSVHMP